MSNVDEDPSVYNTHYEVEVLINGPVAQVWRQHLDVASWVLTHDIAHAYGTPGTVGSINRVAFKNARELGMPPAHHHYCKIIKLVPDRQYVIKTYPEKGGSYGWQIAAFDDTRFAEIDGKTRVTFNLFIEMRSDAALTDRASLDRAMETSREGMLRNLNNLKRIVEGR